MLVADLLTGHTVTTEPVWLAMSADIVHLAAAALWAGGMVALLVAMHSFRAEDDPLGAAEAVKAFSRMATWSVAALVIAGAVLGWLAVRTFDALISTTYGRTLLVKVALGGAVIAVGAYNNRALVPAVERTAVAIPVAVSVGGGSANPPEPPPPEPTAAWTRLRRTMIWEVVGLALVVAVTSVLVNLQPGRGRWRDRRLLHVRTAGQ